MSFVIKSRVYAVGKRVSDLIPELERRMQTTVAATELSTALNAPPETLPPKKAQILAVSNEIVSEWEKNQR